MPREPEIDTAKLIELRYANGLSYQEIADMLGMSPSNVFQRLKRVDSIIPNRAELEIFRQRRADILDGMQMTVLAHVAECYQDETKREKISAYQSTGQFGIYYDKSRLETGKSSQNINVLSRVIELAQDQGDEAIRKISVKPKLPINDDTP